MSPPLAVVTAVPQSARLGELSHRGRDRPPDEQTIGAARLDRPGIDLQCPDRRIDGPINVGVGVGGGDHQRLSEHSATQQLLNEESAEGLRRLAIVVLGREYQT